ncbi:peptidoglycan-recognition protein LD [Condylostylus longicornis]|uniref:peptidoglycan-recognition protein LD n=1 Tax=Condylostylus longicornis TaxID=2530218 RepID=UPI00244E1816|nr:peptidoglycan-recognition protein LD [Condylostylus longicornis]
MKMEGKSKSCYIEIDSLQKFGEAKENTPLLLGKNHRSSLSTKSPSIKSSDSASEITNNGENKNLPYKKFPVHEIFNAKLFAIGLILACGCGIALYLLAVETRIPNGYALDLVSREVWNKIPTHIGFTSLGKSKISNILFLQTGSIECFDTESCINLLRKMQETENLLRNSEIPYNFLIGSDGQTYEIRGWKYMNGFKFVPKETSLVIGFIGNYTVKSPSENQLRSASSLINETKRLKRLDDPFQIYGVRNLTISHLEGDALFKKLSTWPEFDTLLKVL